MRTPADDDAALRIGVEHAGGRTRVSAIGAAWPIRTNEPWTSTDDAGRWIEAVEGAGPFEMGTLRATGRNAFEVAGARVVFRTAGTPDEGLASALAPVVAISIGGVETADVLASLGDLDGAIRSWEVRWPGRPPVRWIVERDERADLLLPRPSSTRAPERLRTAAGAASSAADLALRFSSGTRVDDSTSLTLGNATDRTLLFYVHGVLVGWVAAGGEGRFLGIPAGRNAVRATTLRGTVSIAGTAVVPGAWSATTAARR